MPNPLVATVHSPRTLVLVELQAERNLHCIALFLRKRHALVGLADHQCSMLLHYMLAIRSVPAAWRMHRMAVRGREWQLRMARGGSGGRESFVLAYL